MTAMPIQLLARRVRRGGGDLTSLRSREIALAARYHDPGARDAVVEAFTPLAERLARQYQGPGEALEDLEQVAMIGLIKALERFDAERGAPFVTFATPTITGEIRRHFRDRGWALHVPRASQEAAQRLARLDRTNGRRLTAEESAAALGMSVESVIDARMALHAMFTESLSKPAGEDGDDERPRFMPSGLDDGYERAEERLAITSLLGELPERDRLVIQLRFEESLTQREIGARIGVSQMQVSRILRRALDDLSRLVTAQAA